MKKRFRMIAGPNGSGKSTLQAWLRSDYAVNFYTVLNADEIFASVKAKGAYLPPCPVEREDLVRYAEASEYGEDVKSAFRDGRITVEGDCVTFAPAAVNSYTIALFTNFLQDELIRRETSFSQETVFSHPSKVAALAKAKAAGYRTYLYFVATENPSVNFDRVSRRARQGGHDVPSDKIAARYARSLAQLHTALPHLSRAFFFDNSANDMLYLGEYDEDEGFFFTQAYENLPSWLKTALGLTPDGSIVTTDPNIN